MGVPSLIRFAGVLGITVAMLVSPPAAGAETMTMAKYLSLGDLQLGETSQLLYIYGAFEATMTWAPMDCPPGVTAGTVAAGFRATNLDLAKKDPEIRTSPAPVVLALKLYMVLAGCKERTR